MNTLFAWGLVACSLVEGWGDGPLVDPLTTGEAPPAIALARNLDDLVTLELPESSRPHGSPAPDWVPVVGPFELARTKKGVSTWEAPLPIRPRALFFSSAQPGMAVRMGKRRMPFANGTAGDLRDGSWDYTAQTLQIRRSADDGRPDASMYELSSTKGRQREDALNLATSGLEPNDFAFRSLQLDEHTRFGAFLPAPAVAAWQITVPPNGVFSTEGVLLPPEQAEGIASDGATLHVEIDGESAGQWTITERDWTPWKLDLSAWAGQKVVIALRTDPGPDDQLDYVFLAEPTVYTPVSDPRRAVLVFIDTLRPDHLSSYGYERATTPRLDAWAQDAVVFENARSVAPWTLPSTRTALSGRQPELWREDQTLPQRLAAQGWATGAFVGNIYLSSNFEMADGWTEHSCVNWPVAEKQIERLEDFLDRHDDRDAVVMLHVMDMHLPYTEPLTYRTKWAALKPPAGLSDRALRNSILKAARKDQEGVRQWLIDRYDQNLAYLDDQIADLLEDLGDDVPVVLFADHGEEFWDHDDFEHGHTLYDELLRVPLIVKVPGVAGGRVSENASLLDVAPTFYEALGISTEGTTGRSLIGAMRGEAAELSALADRDLAFGRPLYGRERWGVLSGDTKWTTHLGEEQVFDVAADPGEVRASKTPNLPELRVAFGDAMDVETHLAWRLDGGRLSSSPKQDLVLTITHPDGLAGAFLGNDPLLKSKMTAEFDAERRSVTVTFHKGWVGSREVYLVPQGDPADFHGLVIEAVSGRQTVTLTPSAELNAEPDGQRHTLLRGRAGGRSLTLTYGIAPTPVGEAVEGFDPEVAAALRALGYTGD